MQGKNFIGAQKSSDQLTVDAVTLIGRHRSRDPPANGEQEMEPRDQKTEALIGGASSAKVWFLLSYWLMLQTTDAFPDRSTFYNRFVN